MTLTRSPQPGQAGKGPGDRRALIVLVGLLLVVGLGGIGYLLLSTPDDSVVVDTTPATGSATAGVTGTPGTPSGSPGPSGGTTASSGPTSTTAAGSRNPFAGSAAAGGAGGTTVTTAPAAPTSTAATTRTTSTSAPTSAPRVTTVLTTTLTSTRTVTVTGSSVYLGLYGWTDDGRPMFRVNATASTPAAGATFGTSLVYVSSFVQDTTTCANFTYAGVADTICAGDVRKLS